MSRPETADLQELTKAELVAAIQEQMRATSGCTVFFLNTIADRLGLNPTDHKCLDLILQATASESEPMTPGQLARRTGLTTGAVTSVLDRLERSGFVRREHDAEDRRRIIIRPAMDKVKCDVEPFFSDFGRDFTEMCAQYTEDELRLLIDFSRRCQEMLLGATHRLQSLDAEA